MTLAQIIYCAILLAERERGRSGSWQITILGKGGFGYDSDIVIGLSR